MTWSSLCSIHSHLLKVLHFGSSFVLKSIENRNIITPLLHIILRTCQGHERSTCVKVSCLHTTLPVCVDASFPVSM